MKSIKFFLLLIFGVLGFYSFYLPAVMAVARAPFPDSAALQPIPTFVHPNISGNINHTGIKSNDSYDTDTSLTDNSNTTSTETETKSSSSTLFWVFVWIGILAAFFALVLKIMGR